MPENKLGLFSAFILETHKNMQLEPNKSLFVQGKAFPSSLKIPKELSTPIVMIGNGVGIAPMRAFCQESAWNIINNQPNYFGSIAVFFGTKTKDDRLFNSDFETSQRVGAVNSFIFAFSRETDMPKIYAQDALLKNPEIVIDLLLKKKGLVYVCGSTPLRKGIIQALDTLFSQSGHPNALAQMTKESRIMFECFGGS